MHPVEPYSHTVQSLLYTNLGRMFVRAYMLDNMILYSILYIYDASARILGMFIMIVLEPNTCMHVTITGSRTIDKTARFYCYWRTIGRTANNAFN